MATYTAQDLAASDTWLSWLTDPSLRSRAADIYMSTDAVGSRQKIRRAKYAAVYADPQIAAAKTVYDRRRRVAEAQIVGELRRQWAASIEAQTMALKPKQGDRP